MNKTSNKFNKEINYVKNADQLNEIREHLELCYDIFGLKCSKRQFIQNGLRAVEAGGMHALHIYVDGQRNLNDF